MDTHKSGGSKWGNPPKKVIDDKNGKKQSLNTDNLQKKNTYTSFDVLIRNKRTIKKDTLPFTSSMIRYHLQAQKRTVKIE